MMKDFCVLIDNGHGVDTLGKRSPEHFSERVYEWEYTRKIAESLSCELSKRNIRNVIVTPEDKDVCLSTRASRVNKLCSQYDCILISIHVNAAQKDDTGTGFEVFSTKAKTNSDVLADIFVCEFSEEFPFERNRGHKQCDWTLLYKSKCPCVLTENFFMNNRRDVHLMLSEKGFESIVRYHLNSVIEYMRKMNKRPSPPEKIKHI